MYDILCTVEDNAHILSQQITVFMISCPLQAGQHSPLCLCHQISHPLYLCHHIVSTDISRTFKRHHTPFCVTSYELYITSHSILMSSHDSTYDITASIYETTSSMRATYTLKMWYHRYYLCHHTHCIDNITPTLCLTSHSPYMWNRLHYTRHHSLTFCPQTTILRTSHPLY